MERIELNKLLREIDRKVSVLCANEEDRKKTCPYQIKRIDEVEKCILEFNTRDVYTRINLVETAIGNLKKYRDHEKVFRRVIISLLIGLGGLITWGTNVWPKLVALTHK